jgi:lysophospholipase L1-like esterase
MGLFVSLLLAAAGAPDPHSVAVTVFYDENGNGIADPGEKGRLPGVLVEVGGATGRTEPGTGRAVISNPPVGVQEISLKPETLPPFFALGPAVHVDISERREVFVPVTLPIGSNRPNTYLAFGDSITEGEGSHNASGYRLGLESRLRQYFGEARVIADGVSGATTDRGVRRIRESLVRAHAGYVMVLLGTNDWDEGQDPHAQAAATLENLRIIVRRIRAAGSLPFLASVIPPNVGYDWRVPRERDSWVSLLDEMIAPMAREEGAVFVDLHAVFKSQADPRALFTDHLHPNERGYNLIVETLFESITHGHAPQTSPSRVP